MTQLSDSDALRAFLACSDGDLCERARLWLEFLKEVEREMKIKEDLAGGSNEQLPKNKD